MKTQLQIGVTGGIGSGKSLICKIFEALKIPVYYADDHAKKLMLTSAVKEKITHHFGTESYSADGTLNNIFLGKEVFSSPAKLELLNSIVHPAVAEDFELWTGQHKNAPYLIKEAALIFESGSYKSLDYVINVTASVNIRIERVLIRDPFRNREQILNIIKKQLSDEERKSMADFNIVNDNSMLVIPQVIALHRQFTAKKS